MSDALVLVDDVALAVGGIARILTLDRPEQRNPLIALF